jgi:predicted NodU family carbamoyl transferase
VSSFIGVHDGHNASVALVRDGKIELALQEERLTRVKNQGDAPMASLRMARGMLNEQAGQTKVALNGRS